jgi:hypothetical protein
MMVQLVCSDSLTDWAAAAGGSAETKFNA